MESDDVTRMNNQAAMPVRAAYAAPEIEVVETIDGVIATAPGPTTTPGGS